MNSKIKNVLFTAALLITTQSFAQANLKGGLSEVERETCLSFPMITPVAQMIKDVHYENHTYCSDEDNHGGCTTWSEYTKLKYNYLNVTTVDYYNSLGKLVTTKINKSKVSESVVAGASLDEGVERLKVQIQKIIFDSSNEVCKDSYYK